MARRSHRSAVSGNGAGRQDPPEEARSLPPISEGRGNANQPADLQIWMQRQNELENTMREVLRTVQFLTGNQQGPGPRGDRPVEAHEEVGENHAPREPSQRTTGRNSDERPLNRVPRSLSNNQGPQIFTDDLGRRHVQLSRGRRSRMDYNSLSDRDGQRDRGDLRDTLQRVRRERPQNQDSRDRSPSLGSERRVEKRANQEVLDLERRLTLLEQRRGIQPEPVNQYMDRNPFTPEINNEPIPERFKMPSMPVYEAASDPFNHLDLFNVQMDLITNNNRVKCRCFPATLGETPRKWFRSLPPRSISSWEQCQEMFLQQYQALRRQLVPLCHLATIYQKQGEPLKGYLARFQKEASYVDRPSDESMLTAVSAGLEKNGRLYKSLYKSPVRTLQEFYERAQQYIRMEETFGSKKSTTERRSGAEGTAKERRPDDKVKDRDHRRSDLDDLPTAKKARNSDPRPRQGRFNTYAQLSDSRDRIFATERGRENFGAPRPMITPQRNRKKFCHYHNDVGHSTADCYELKDAIEDLIRRGRLKDYVVKSRERNHQSPPHQPQNDERSDGRTNAKKVTIDTIHGGPHLAGSSSRSHARYIREAAHPPLTLMQTVERPGRFARIEGITFGPEDARGVHWPHNDALVVKITVGNIDVKRVMIDNGSSVNVLYKSAYDKMGLGPEHLRSAPEPLYGFTGDSILPKGMITLPLTIGEPGRTATTMANFLIIDSPSAYNAILGRPALNELEIVTSTRFLCAKFPTQSGVGCIKGEQLSA